MDQRQIYDKAYVDALRTNESETTRWSAYRQEHLDLKANLRMYQKSPRADILIPMGTKALLPGQLYHTGEILVSHGGGYFSECSSEQAQAMADRRIRLADEMLQKYERERSMYSDKLEVPFANEVFAPQGGGQEIIEPYDEQAEARWREEHRRRVRESKQKEAKMRHKQPLDQDDKQVFEKLEEMELLEELEKEMDQLEMPEDDDDQLGRLMRGEIRLNEKQRTAHQRKHEAELPAMDAKPQTRQEKISSEKKSNAPQEEDVESPDEDEEVETTDEEGSVDGTNDEDEDISPEFAQLLNETKSLPKKKKIEIFQAKLKEVRQRLYENSVSIIEKVDLYQMYEELEEALDFLRPAEHDEDEKEDAGTEATVDKPVGENNETNRKPPKKISFSDQNQVKLIDGRYGPAPAGKEPFGRSTEKTLFLPITHSTETFPGANRQPAEKDEIVSPADIYRLFEEKAPNPQAIKSILKNKKQHTETGIGTALRTDQSRQKVTHAKQEKAVPINLLGDIVEHKIDKMEDACAEVAPPPQQKKKVSRFKKERQH